MVTSRIYRFELSEGNMPRIGLTTFLCNDSGDSVTKSRKMAKYAEDPGGSDYYWGVKEACKHLLTFDEPFDLAAGVMGNMKLGHQRTANMQILEALLEWKRKHSGSRPDCMPPAGEFVGPAKHLIVRLQPAFGWVHNGTPAAYILWNYKELRLSKGLAGMGVFLLEAEFRKGLYQDWDFYILDTITNRRFGRSSITTSSERAAVCALKHQEELYLLARDQAA